MNVQEKTEVLEELSEVILEESSDITLTELSEGILDYLEVNNVNFEELKEILINQNSNYDELYTEIQSLVQILKEDQEKELERIEEEKLENEQKLQEELIEDEEVLTDYDYELLNLTEIQQLETTELLGTIIENQEKTILRNEDIIDTSMIVLGLALGLIASITFLKLVMKWN